MAINNLNEKFLNGLADIYDAEHQFLKGQEEMLQSASDPKLQQMINTHIQQTKQQISNLDQIFGVLGQQPQRVMCAGAKGIVSEAQQLIQETQGSDTLRDCAIAGAADKVEHYEIASYRGLISDATLMGQQGVVALLQQNLEQEESTAQLIETSAPELLQKAMQAEGIQPQQGFSQAYPTY